jgi:PST family polysaccharide transporter
MKKGADGEGVDLQDLKRKSLRGGKVTVGAQAASIIIQLLSTVTLARLLSPADYGFVAMVMAVTGFVGLFRDFGLSAAAIQRTELTSAQQSGLFWLNVLIGGSLTILLATASPLVAWFYGEPKLMSITQALSITFLLASAGTQSGVSLVREMRFDKQAGATISGALVTLAVSVWAASRGMGYWALVWGNIVGTATSTGLLLWLSSFRPMWPRKNIGARSLVSFGASITAFDFVNYFQRNLDNILIGKLCTADVLGLYSRAYQLLMFPINAIRGPINSVAFPAMSKLQIERDKLRDYYLQTTTLIAFLSMPLCAFCYISVDPLVRILLGEKWIGVSSIFKWLAAAAFIQPAAGFSGSLVMSLGQGRRYLYGGIFNSIVICLGFAIGVQWGAIGVAMSYAITNYIILYPWLSYAFRKTPVTFIDFCSALKLPILVSIAGLAIAAPIALMIKGSPALLQLAILGASFGAGSTTLLLSSTQGRLTLKSFLSHIRGT